MPAREIEKVPAHNYLFLSKLRQDQPAEITLVSIVEGWNGTLMDVMFKGEARRLEVPAQGAFMSGLARFMIKNFEKPEYKNLEGVRVIVTWRKHPWKSAYSQPEYTFKMPETVDATVRPTQTT